MNPLGLAERLRADYRRFTWSTYPVADSSLRGQLERMVEQDALLWRGPYLSVQPRFEQSVTLAELASSAGLPAEVVAAFRERNIRYLVLSAEFLDRYYNRRVCDWMFELSQREPEAVVFRTSLSRVLDLGRLPAR